MFFNVVVDVVSIVVLVGKIVVLVGKIVVVIAIVLVDLVPFPSGIWAPTSLCFITTFFCPIAMSLAVIGAFVRPVLKDHDGRSLRHNNEKKN